MKIKNIIPILICTVALTACSQTNEVKVRDNQEYERTVYAMDTVMTLKAYGKNGEKALDDAENEIEKLDNALRRGNNESEIYKVNSEKSAQVSDETAALVREALDICESTDGAFDISIAPVMDLWGFYTKDFYVPNNDELATELEKVNYKNIIVEDNTISVSENSQLDLGGIAKGYLSSRIMEIFTQDGVTSGIISLGGNVQTLGKKIDGSNWKVAIQNPDDETYIGGLAISDMAVITSGGYQRYFEQDGVIYHHIINPKTGYPAQNGVKSVSIVSDNGTLADGLSTALFVMGLDEGIKYWSEHDGFDVVFVTDDNGIYITEGIADIFESKYNYSVIKKTAN
jgi:thiamine biosynthesis lipoprotein